MERKHAKSSKPSLLRSLKYLTFLRFQSNCDQVFVLHSHSAVVVGVVFLYLRLIYSLRRRFHVGLLFFCSSLSLLHPPSLTFFVVPYSSGVLTFQLSTQI